MRSPEEVRRARALIGAARDFLLEKEKEGSAVLTFEFQAGALHALEWMLGAAEDDPFSEYLVSLEMMYQAMFVERP